MDAGSRIAMVRSAMGRAYIAVCDESERLEIFKELEEQDPAGWPELQACIERSQEVYVKLGCATSFGDWEPSIIGVAVGFRPGGGLAPMSLNCGAVSMLSSPKFLMEEMLPRLKLLATEIEVMMGGR